jgi:hypothetical protein
VGSLDLPDQPDEAGGTDRSAPKSRELPDPDERGRAYEAARAHVSAETPAEESPGQGPDAGGQRAYKDEVPRFRDTRAEHGRPWLEGPQAAADRSGDRPELPAATAGAAGRIGEAERMLSADAQAIEQENKHAGRLQGMEHRLKGEDRLNEKSPAETAEEPSRGQPHDTADQRTYWDEVPRFQDMWNDHERRWPAERRAAVDRSDDPPWSYRSDGGFYLNAEQHAETTETIRKIRGAEPRISADMQAAEQENRYGGWIEGFQHRLKGEDRLKEKAAEELAAEQLKAGARKTPAEVVRQIPDAIRCTFCFERETYARGYYDIKERLESYGYEMYQSKNSWGGREYKGINTRWVTQEGHRFEVQFHTPESFHAKEYVTHKAYERIRNPLISDRERKELKEYQREVSSTIRTPDGATDIPDYEKKGL